jgi:hypothetical protein
MNMNHIPWFCFLFSYIFTGLVDQTSLPIAFACTARCEASSVCKPGSVMSCYGCLIQSVMNAATERDSARAKA